MSHAKTKQDRQQKPYPGFPLYPHGNGQYAKKIRGRVRYFGAIAAGWKPALERYNQEKDDLHAGREPQPFVEGLTLADLWTDFLLDFQKQVDLGKKGYGSWTDHQRTGKYVVAFLGRNTLVNALRGGDWKKLRDHWEEIGFAPSTIAGHVARVRAVFNWAYEDEELIELPMRFGRRFKRPEKVEFRRHRDGKDAKLLSASEIHRLVGAASPAMRAMVFLGLNAGMGNKECGFLEFRHLDLTHGWLTCRRTKNYVPRRAKLWPETVLAIEAAIESRPLPKTDELVDRVFITKYGGPWAFERTRTSPVAQQFAKLRKLTGIRPTASFYDLRHTFRTEANEQIPNDAEAIRTTIGHTNARIDDEYIERFPTARLESVSEFVRSWYLSHLGT